MYTTQFTKNLGNTNKKYSLYISSKGKKDTQSTRKGYKKDTFDVNNYVAKRDPITLILPFFFM